MGRWIILMFWLWVPLGASAESAHLLNNQGLTLMQQQRWSEAADSFERAYNLDKNEPVIRQNLAAALNAWGVAQGEAEQYEQAEKNLAKANSLVPQNKIIRRNLSIMRSNWATTLSEAKLYLKAESIYAQATQTAPEEELGAIRQRRSDNLVMAARLTRDAGQSSDAIKLYRQALELNPDQAGAHLDLGELYYESGDTLEALDHFLAAEKINPEIEGLKDHIDRLARESATEARFDEKTDRSFRVVYDGQANTKAASQVLTILRRAQAEIGRALDYRPLRTITVVLYTKTQYQNVTVAPHWSGALYDGRIRVPIRPGQLQNKEQAQLEQALMHEYTHAIVHDLGGATVPTWLNEGLATYYELPADQRNRRYEKETAQMERWRGKGELTKISELPEVFLQIEDKDEAGKAYAISRTFVTWLAKRYGEARFKTVLNELGQGASVDQALSSAYRSSLVELETQWRRGLN